MADPKITITNPHARETSAGGIVFGPGASIEVGPEAFQGPEGKWLAWACEPEVGLLTVQGTAEEALKVAASGKAKGELVGDLALVCRSLAKVGQRVAPVVAKPPADILTEPRK